MYSSSKSKNFNLSLVLFSQKTRGWVVMMLELLKNIYGQWSAARTLVYFLRQLVVSITQVALPPSLCTFLLPVIMTRYITWQLFLMIVTSWSLMMNLQHAWTGIVIVDPQSHFFIVAHYITTLPNHTTQLNIAGQVTPPLQLLQ